MRVTYYGYALKHLDGGLAQLIDLRRFISEFVAADALDFKRTLNYGGETLLLLPFAPSVYLFVQTRDLEIIKRVHQNNWSADDIRQILRNDQSIGFASYVSIHDNWFGIACRLMSPRITALGHFFNTMLEKLEIPYRLELKAFQTSIQPQEVGGLDRVGSIRISIDAQTGIGQQFLNLLTAGADGVGLDVAALDVRIVPRRSRNSDLTNTLQSIVERYDPQSMMSLEARARLEAADRMSDIYIYGAGAIHDFVNVEHEREVAAEMTRLARENRVLREKIQEFVNDDDNEAGHAAGDAGISWARAYARWLALSHQ